MATTTTLLDSSADGAFDARKDAHQRHDSGNTSRSPWKIDEKGRFQAFPWDPSTLELPQHIGKATTSVSLQKATKTKYGAMAVTGLSTFYLSSSPAIRTAGLSLLFPGAGFLAVGGIAGVLGFILAVGFIPVALFAWFGAGGLAFPLADWLVSGMVATWLAGSTVVESSPTMALGFLAVVWTYLNTRTVYEEEAESAKKDRRNRTLMGADSHWKTNSDAAGPPGSRELTLEQLRYLQRIVDLSLKDFDDWEGFTDIDQFQTAALRYQLYDLVYCLSTWTSAYAPSFRGYLAAGMRNAIEKSLTRKVMNFWKWESLWGKFTTLPSRPHSSPFSSLANAMWNWDPIIKDNIMVTGYMVLACGLYQSCTGDDRYAKEESLEYQVTNRKKYKHSIHTMNKALHENWRSSKHLLYPCEPNWIYSMCNLEGVAGAVVYDRLNKSTEGKDLLARFLQKFEEDFFTKGGSCIPIRSGITGFTIPGLCGIVGDCSNAITCAPTMPTLAKRMWLLAREESLRWREDGKIEAVGLKGADAIDVGNYKPSEHGAYAMFAVAAAEWGDRKVADACLERVEEFCPVQTNPNTGAKWNLGLSTIGQSWISRSRMSKGGDWANAVGVGVEEKCLAGPLVDHAPYPDVLVAKAYSPTGKNLDLVFYPGRKPGKFEIQLSQLQPNAQYASSDGQKITADGKGRASVTLNVDGRTAVQIEPASA